MKKETRKMSRVRRRWRVEGGGGEACLPIPVQHGEGPPHRWTKEEI